MADDQRSAFIDRLVKEVARTGCRTWTLARRRLICAEDQTVEIDDVPQEVVFYKALDAEQYVSLQIMTAPQQFGISRIVLELYVLDKLLGYPTEYDEMRQLVWNVTERDNLREYLEHLFTDAQAAFDAGAHYAACLLYRPCVEGLLLALLLPRESEARDPNGPWQNGNPKKRRTLYWWRFVDLIECAGAMKILDDIEVSDCDAIRDYGNLIHPGRHLRKSIRLTPNRDAVIVRELALKLLERHGAAKS